MENANTHPLKVVTVEDEGMKANSHPYAVEVIAGDNIATEDWVDERIRGLWEEVETLPETGEEGVTYYVAKEGETDTFDLYRWVNNGWIKIDTDVKLYSTTGDNSDGSMTQEATTTALGNKQDKLTPGANISIDANNEISATDTTYSNFVGTDGQTAGAAGLVPAPATTDDGKFLNADGSWTAVPPANFATGEAVSSLKIYSGLGSNNDGLVLQKYVPVKVVIDPDTSGQSTKKVHLGLYNSNGQRLVPDNVIQVGAGLKLSHGSSTNQKTVLIRSVPFTGATASADGEEGAVPKPLTGEQDKVLYASGSWGINYKTINGAGAPTTATVGDYVGQLYLDTTNDKMYYLSAITSGNPDTYTWEELGGGPAVVQTTGTSTTDVMSQNAVTNALSGKTTLYSKIQADVNTPIPSLKIAGNGTDTYPYAPCYYEDAHSGEELWSYIRAYPIFGDITQAYVGKYGYEAADSNWDGKEEARLALYSDIPATFTTNEWNALWS